jgi:lipoprotein-anchoring transpeptidase ErfK/SrfK
MMITTQNGGMNMNALNETLERCLRELQKPAPVVVTPQAPIGDLATPKQIEFYTALVTGKQMALGIGERAEMIKNAAMMTKKEMSQAISNMMGLPWIPREQQVRTAVITGQPAAPVTKPVQKTWDTIGAGHYAVVDPKDQVLKFYKVQRPKKGNWVGYVFIKRVSGENLEPVGNAQEREVIFREIEKDVMGALKRYGQEIGQCGHCKKQLTDAESRAFGIGPVCRKALGI